MTKSIRTYRPAASWITVGLLTLVMLSFGLFAQHRVDSRSVPLVDGKSSAINVYQAGVMKPPAQQQNQT